MNDISKRSKKKKSGKEATKLKKYDVTFYYHTNCSTRVYANNPEEALRKAEDEVCDDKYIKQILDGLQEDDSPDVVEVN